MLTSTFLGPVLCTHASQESPRALEWNGVAIRMVSRPWETRVVQGYNEFCSDPGYKLTYYNEGENREGAGNGMQAGYIA